MKKLTLLLAVLTILLSGIRAAADDCGHQHAERCLVNQPTVTKDADKVDLSEKILIFARILIRSWPPI